MNGRQAMESLDYSRHDIIFMDVQMPGMDGLAATAAIRDLEKETGKHIPIVAMTAHAMQGDREKCLDSGMDGYLTKPLHPGPIREAIRQWVVEDHRTIDEVRAPRSTEEPSFLEDLLRKSCGNNLKLIAEILGLMLTYTPARLERLEAAVKEGDGHQVSWEAHTLKGGFLTIGAEPLATNCQELVVLGEREDHATIESVFCLVRDQWNQLKDEATRYLETHPNHQPPASVPQAAWISAPPE